MNTVEAPKRTAWTDPRLDDLGKKVDDGFTKTDEKTDGLARDLRGEMKAGFAKVDERFDKADKKMDEGFARADTRFFWLMVTLLAAAAGIIGTLVGVNASETEPSPDDRGKVDAGFERSAGDSRRSAPLPAPSGRDEGRVREGR